MIRRFLSDSHKYFLYAVNAAKAQLKAEVANSYLNWIWWILEPVCFTFIYYTVFGVLFNLKEQYMISFIMVAVSLWDFFNRMMKNSVNIMRTNKSIVSRIYLPKYVLIYVRIGVNGFKMLITLLIAAATMIVLKVPVSWHVFLAIPILLVFMMFCFGLGCILLHFGVYVDDLNHVVEIVLRMIFYLTGIFYNVEKRIPAPLGGILAKVNPIAYCINALRNVLLYRTVPDLSMLLIWFDVSLLLCIFGVYTVYKNENSYVKSI